MRLNVIKKIKCMKNMKDRMSIKNRKQEHQQLLYNTQYHPVGKRWETNCARFIAQRHKELMTCGDIFGI